MKRSRLTKSNHQPVLEMFEQGLSVQRIAQSFNVYRADIVKVVNDQFPSWQGRKVPPVKAIIAQYKNGGSVRDIANQHGLYLSTVEGVVKASIADFEPVVDEEFEYNNFFEVIDSPLKAYWLGYIYVSDFIHYDMSGMTMPSNELTTLVGGAAGSDSLYSVKLCQDLVDKGCLPRTSSDLGQPFGINGFVEDFVCGWLMAKGKNYYIAKPSPLFDLTGPYSLLDWLTQELNLPNGPVPYKNSWKLSGIEVK